MAIPNHGLRRVVRISTLILVLAVGVLLVVVAGEALLNEADSTFVEECSATSNNCTGFRP